MSVISLSRDAILGSWRLVRTYETLNGEDRGKSPLGEGAYGVLHYLDDDRVCVLMANAGRTRMSAGRYNSGLEETAQSATSFTAYAGRFTVMTDRIVHHLDICLYENDAQTDYIRIADLAGDRLTLKMLPVATPKGDLQWCLEWERLAPAQALR